MSEDPIQDGLNWYTYCSANPILFVDPSGCELVLYGTDEEKNTILENLQKLTDHDLAYDAETGLLYIETLHSGDLQYTEGNKLLIRLINNEEYTTTIVINKNETGNMTIKLIEDTIKYGIHSDSFILFDPTYDPDIIVINSETGEMYESKRPAYIGLAHELIHADRLMRGICVEQSKNCDLLCQIFYNK